MTTPQHRRLHAVLPVKSFGRAKSRLSPALSAGARSELAAELFERALAAALGCPAIAEVLIATDGEDVAALCRARGIEVLRDPPGLRVPLPLVVDRALSHSRRRGAADALVLMADLPRVSAGDLGRLLSAPTRADVLLVPDARARGTNALRLPLDRGFHTCFGHPDSRRMHLAEAARCGLSVATLACDGLALDLDRPAELAQALPARLRELAGRRGDACSAT